MPEVTTEAERSAGRSGTLSRELAVAALLLLLSVSVGLTAASRPAIAAPLFAVSGLAIAVGLLYWSVSRLGTALVLLFVVRPSLDHFKLKPGSSALNEPTIMVGILLLTALVAWLFLRWRARGPIMLSRSSLAFVALAAASLVSSLTADFPDVSLEASARLVSSALLFVVLEQVLRDRPDLIRPLLVAVFASLLVPAVVAGFQWYGNVPETPMYGPAIDVGRIRGTFVHPNAFASHLVILIPLAVALVAVVRGWARTWLVVTGTVSALLLLFTYARGAWIACLLAVLVVGWLQDRRIVWLVIAATLVALIAIPSVSTRLSDLSEDDDPAIVGDPDSLEWRLGYWAEVLPRTMEGPITGIGLGSIEQSSPLRLAPHNVFVQTLVEMGLAGLTALLFLIASLAVDLSRALRRASQGLDRAVVAGAVGVSVGLLVQCLSENLLNGTMVQMYSLVPLAWATRRSPVAVLVGGAAAPAAVRSPT